MSQGDIADRANDLSEKEREASQAAIQARAAIKPVATGRCFYCDEITADDVRFCNAYCRDSWQHEQDARKRNGR